MTDGTNPVIERVRAAVREAIRSAHPVRASKPSFMWSTQERETEAVVAALLPFLNAQASLEAMPDVEAKVVSYEHAHEVALELGYPSLTEALEALSDVVGLREALEGMVDFAGKLVLQVEFQDDWPHGTVVLEKRLSQARAALAKVSGVSK